MRRLMIALAALMACGTTFAMPGSALAAGQCGGPANSNAQLLANWNRLHVIPKIVPILRVAGFNPDDSSVGGWFADRVVIAPQARASVTRDWWCVKNRIGEAGPKHLARGHRVFVVLPDQFSKQDVRFTSAPGWKLAGVFKVRIVADTGCGNPHLGWTWIAIYVRAPKKPVLKPVQPSPQPPQGSCNAVNSPGSIVCSTFYVVVTCGSSQITITGNSAAEALANATAYEDSHNCNSTVVVNPPPPPPPPPPPAPVSPKPVVVVNTIQEVDTSDYSTNPPTISRRPIDINVFAPAGDVVDLSGLSVGLGTLDVSSAQVTGQGMTSPVTVTVTFTAGTAPGSTQLTGSASDANGAQVPFASNVFDVDVPQGNPGHTT